MGIHNVTPLHAYGKDGALTNSLILRLVLLLELPYLSPPPPHTQTNQDIAPEHNA